MHVTRMRMRQKIREIVNDTHGRPRFPESMLNDWLNEEFEFVVSESDWPFQRQTYPITILADVEEYPLDTQGHIQKLELLKDPDDKISRRLLDEYEWYSTGEAGYIVTDEPLRIRIRPTTPGEVWTAIVLRRYSIPITDDEPFECPGPLRDATVARVAALCWERERDFTAATYYAQKGELALREAKRTRDIRSNEPYTMRMERSQ